MIEEWRDIVAAPGYQVSSFGGVRSIDRSLAVSGQTRRYRARIIAPTSNQYGHLKVPLRIAVGKPKMFYVHALVAAAFIGPRPSGMEVAHNDGNPANNRIDNLRYATPTQNQADKRIHGTHGAGEAHPAALLSEADVQAIRGKLAAGIPQKALAAEYGVARTTISAISTGRSWK
jgi:hypothetical protein